jgi:hypothetical protein
METILILAESHQQLQFFGRFKKSFLALNKNIIIITDKPSVLLKAKTLNIKEVVLIKYKNGICNSTAMNKAVELLSLSLTYKQVSILYESTYNCAHLLIEKYSKIVIFVWSGNSVSSIALKELAKKYSLEILYFERANYPGKIFVDPCGTNLQSFLYKNIHILDLPLYLEKFRKTDDHEVIETQVLQEPFIENNNYFLWLDVLYSFFSKLPFRGEYNLLKIVRNKISKSLNVTEYHDCSKTGFYLIALPHSYELKKKDIDFSNISKIIKEILNKAELDHVEIFVKFHPQENYAKFIRQILGIKYNEEQYFIKHNMKNLISNSKKIFLFNTSFAIEVILRKKDCEFLEHSLFEQMNYDRVINYIDKYLIELRMDKDGFFLPETLMNVLNRIHLA